MIKKFFKKKHVIIIDQLIGFYILEKLTDQYFVRFFCKKSLNLMRRNFCFNEILKLKVFLIFEKWERSRGFAKSIIPSGFFENCCNFV